MMEEYTIPFYEDFGVVEGNLSKAYNQLELYVNAYRPLIYIQSFDFAVIDSMICCIAESVPDRKKKIVEFVEGVGIVSFLLGKKMDKEYENIKTLRALLESYAKIVIGWDDLEDYDTPKDIILYLKNVHNELSRPEIQSLIRQIISVSMREHGDESLKTFVYIIVVSPELVIPTPLERLIAFIKLNPPSELEIKKHIESALKKLIPPIILSDKAYEKMTSSLLGLSFVEIDQVLSLIFADNKSLVSKETQEAILAEKRQIIQKNGLLKIIDNSFDDQEIGGLDNLQQYLNEEAKIYEQLDSARDNGVEIPKGVLIVGMPGCGKTMTAKLAAKKFKVPLICLDVGRLMGPYVGQSEENLRRALEMVESVAPCVLWIDELEKAFSGVVSAKGAGSEVTTRMFGHFLTWMQEKQDSVYVIATANRINQLPPELLRRGRFDEIFCVDFPTAEEQKEILKVHLKQRGYGTIDIATLQLKTGFCGADIAAIVSNAIKKAFLESDISKQQGNRYDSNKDKSERIEQELILKKLEEEANQMTPLRERLADDIKQLAMVLNKYDFKPASKNQLSKYII